ncbi:dihydrodipicolinate synthase family protein [Actinomadura madurae]|nr:dihydrodipicolinate synthase family protein [Actinomadura madurae]MCP9982066.1 dihydrodipicolinate synthase family protein [Actinomadura madurae]
MPAAARDLTLPGAASMAFIAYVSTLFCFGAWGWLIRRYEAGTVAMYSLLVPPFGLASAAVLLGEHVDAVRLARRRADHRGGRGGQPPPAAPHSRGRGPPVGPRHRSGTNEVRPMHGIHASLVTPFTRSGEVDAKSLERLAVHCLDNGADGLVALGTTGEAALLSAAERRTVLEVCRAVSLEHGTPLTVGAGTMGTEDSIRQARERAPLADALLVVVPYYLRPSDEGVVDHFAAVGAAVDVPSSPTTCRTGRRSPCPRRPSCGSSPSTASRA